MCYKLMEVNTRKIKVKQRKHLFFKYILLILIFNVTPKKVKKVIPMSKNTSLKLFTKSWPLDGDNKEESTSRPLTATLDKPSVLNISLMRIIDMSTVRKEFLSVSNLCRFPISLTITKRQKTIITNRPLSLPSPEKHKIKKDNKNNNKRPETSENIYEEASIIKNTTFLKPKKSQKKIHSVQDITSDANNNNNKTFRIPRKRIGNVVKILEVNKCNIKSIKLPEPCKTCGRPDQPERFHSHPDTPPKSAKKNCEPQKIKNTVQKPIAIKYKSKQSGERTSPSHKSSLPIHNSMDTQLTVSPAGKIQNENASLRIKSAKRTLTCYICGREFGTASLPLHEPKCIQKWKRQNADLPSHLQKNAPIKPEHTNELNSWETFQLNLTPCMNCGRTFYPDRLIVHQRSCKVIQNNWTAREKLSPRPLAAESKFPVDKVASISSPAVIPPSAGCSICGKLFGTHSIKIHEKQCLKKWHAQNDTLSENIRTTEPPLKREHLKAQKIPETKINKERPSSASKKPTMVPCYICGRLFTINSICIHEPQCLKMWKIENEKLPLHKRKTQPLKPDIKLTDDGGIDYEATNEERWQSHLSQLIPCQFCSRTFNPDRVEVHEKSCKG